jgi:hypothetical protein
VPFKLTVLLRDVELDLDNEPVPVGPTGVVALTEYDRLLLLPVELTMGEVALAEFEALMLAVVEPVTGAECV